MSCFAALAVLSATALAAPIEWEFPREGGCHEGLAFADGVTGVLVWGGGGTIRLTVGRADLWDHRGGYPWTPEQSYTNIVAAVQSNDKPRLLALFKKTTPPGQPRNPYMLPLGRVEVRLAGASLVRGSLDPFTGLGALTLSDGRRIELAMSKQSHAFAMRFPQGLAYTAAARHCMSFPAARAALSALGFAPADPFADPNGRSGGFRWSLPADAPVSLAWWRKDDSLLLATARSTDLPRPDCSFAAVRDQSRAHWQRFWAASAKVHVPDARIQAIYDYGMYRFGAMTDPDGVPAGLQGPWLEDDKLVPWNGDYHFNINVQECYSPAYRGGHAENLRPLFAMIRRWWPRLRENARLFCGVEDGFVLPHSVDDRGVCIGGFWTGTIDHASTAWVAAMMYRYVQYTGDLAFLKSDAYPFMRGALRVYRAMMEEREGALSLPLGPSPEWGGADVRTAVGRDPSFQLAAAHRLARDLIAAARLLGETPDPAALDIERMLPPYSAGPGGISLFADVPFSESHRHHSHLAGLYPFNTIDFSSGKAADDVRRSYTTWVGHGTGAWSGWCVPWASILHTHAGNAEAAVWMLHAWEIFFCNPGHGSRHNAYRPGFSWMGRAGLGHEGDPNGGEIMQMDGHCAAVTAILEMMVHEVNGRTELFRGCPARWKEVSFENIRTSDGRALSARR